MEHQLSLSWSPTAPALGPTVGIMRERAEQYCKALSNSKPVNQRKQEGFAIQVTWAHGVFLTALALGWEDEFLSTVWLCFLLGKTSSWARSLGLWWVRKLACIAGLQQGKSQQIYTRKVSAQHQGMERRMWRWPKVIFFHLHLSPSMEPSTVSNQSVALSWMTNHTEKSPKLFVP